MIHGGKEMPNLSRLGLVFFAVVVILALTPGIGFGQNVYGTIAGTVTDNSGAVVAAPASL